MPEPSPDPGLSQPGEPTFAIGIADVGAGVQFVAMTIQTTNGITIQFMLRPELALTVARLLSDKGKIARTGLIVPRLNGDMPQGLDG